MCPFNISLLKLNHSQNGFPVVKLDDNPISDCHCELLFWMIKLEAWFSRSTTSYVSMNKLLFFINLLNYYDSFFCSFDQRKTLSNQSINQSINLLNNRVDEMKEKSEHITQLEDQLKKREEEVEPLRKIIEIERFQVQFFFSSDNSMISLLYKFYSLTMLIAVLNMSN